MLSLSIVGRAIIVHSAQDDCISITSSGGRLGGGVIGIANPTTFSLTGTNVAANSGT